jgi:hypothetical protein
MIARLAGDRDTSKDVFLTSKSKRDAGKKNEKRNWAWLVGGGQWHVDHLLTDSFENNNATP